MGRKVQFHSMIRYIRFVDDDGNVIKTFELNEQGKHIQPITHFDFYKETPKINITSVTLENKNIIENRGEENSNRNMEKDLIEKKTPPNLSMIQLDSLFPQWDEDITEIPQILEDSASFFESELF